MKKIVSSEFGIFQNYQYCLLQAILLFESLDMFTVSKQAYSIKRHEETEKWNEMKDE